MDERKPPQTHLDFLAGWSWARSELESVSSHAQGDR